MDAVGFWAESAPMAPAFGEHTDEVLREAGYSDQEIAAMVESGAAAGPGSESATTFRA